MPYRDDEEALEARRVELQRELADVRARAADAEKFVARQREIERALERIEQRKAAGGPARLPMLASAKIASPCSADWYEMTGDDRVRFCNACKKDVYDLSSMTAPEAEALMVEKGIDLCARFYRRRDGRIMTADCPVGVHMKWMNRIGAAVVLFVGGAAALSWYTRKFPVQQHQYTAGAIGYEQPP
jgi:hypothetical protein